MDKELEKMDKLLSDLTAVPDRIRKSCTNHEAGFSVSRSAVMLSQANKRMEEARNVLSGVWMTSGPMDQLAEMLIVRILNFMPVQQWFVCMSVNKRWLELARLTVKNHRRVYLVWKGILRDPKGELPLNFIVQNGTESALSLQHMAQSLLLMEKLSHLETLHGLFKSEYVNPIIGKNAAFLQVLETGYNLPSPHQGPVVYPQLKKLNCRFMSQGTECPVLEHLITDPCCPAVMSTR